MSNATVFCERRLWEVDQAINDRGIKVDQRLVTQAIALEARAKSELTARAVELTGLKNPNSIAQLKEWLGVEGLTKKDVTDLLLACKDRTRTQVLQLRQQLCKSSVAKFEAIRNSVCQDGRVRGLLQFSGAGRTGRWTGRLVQVQNLPQNKYKDLELARELVLDGRYDDIKMLYGSIGEVLSQLVRTAFIGPFTVADFSAIEARVLAWLAGEAWRLKVFETHGRIYESSAEQMFGLPAGSVDKASPYRTKGKISELACGYQGGVNALINMGALDMGLAEEELPSIIKQWRMANPNIVDLWHRVERAARTAITRRVSARVGYLRFTCDNDAMRMVLPSGRALVYRNAKIKNDKITFWGVDQTTKRWCEMDTFGGRLVENACQAVARDCLAHTLLEASHLPVVMHVHDEVVIEDEHCLDEVLAIMAAQIPWAPGLVLKGDGYVCEFYRKD